MTTKTQIKETMKGKLPRKKPRKKMLDLLMEQKDKKISYEELKRGAESGVG